MRILRKLLTTENTLELQPKYNLTVDFGFVSKLNKKYDVKVTAMKLLSLQCTIHLLGILPPFHMYLFLGVSKIVKGDHWLRHVCLSVCLSPWNNSAPPGWIFMKFGI